jgi:hypothetical protein
MIASCEGEKGALSEAELHVLRARLRGGILNKARRGALKLPLPVGFQYREDGQLILAADQQIQQTIQVFFETFRRTGSASGTVRTFRERGLSFPQRVPSGPHRGEVFWRPLQHSTALELLHNPRYAGAFVFGRTRTRLVGGQVRVKELPREQWGTLLPGAHAGYISWDEYEENQRRLRENAQARGGDRHACPPREGPALEASARALWTLRGAAEPPLPPAARSPGPRLRLPARDHSSRGAARARSFLEASSIGRSGNCWCARSPHKRWRWP